jgi:hypothetical protein
MGNKAGYGIFFGSIWGNEVLKGKDVDGRVT